jgi:hypothetical protein
MAQLGAFNRHPDAMKAFLLLHRDQTAREILIVAGEPESAWRNGKEECWKWEFGARGISVKLCFLDGTLSTVESDSGRMIELR